MTFKYAAQTDTQLVSGKVGAEGTEMPYEKIIRNDAKKL